MTKSRQTVATQALAMLRQEIPKNAAATIEYATQHRYRLVPSNIYPCTLAILDEAGTTVGFALTTPYALDAVMAIVEEQLRRFTVKDLLDEERGPLSNYMGFSTKLMRERQGARLEAARLKEQAATKRMQANKLISEATRLTERAMSLQRRLS